jgi:starch synthase
MLKAGIAYADQISTVSPRYASEIQQAAQGQGLQGFLRLHSARLSGVLNGIDTQIWDPAHDPVIARTYSLTSLNDKEANVRALTSILGLDNVPRGPRCAVISRLTEQKGLGLIVQAAPIMIQDGAQLVVLGNGEAAIERQFEALQAQHPGKVSFRSDFDERLAHQMIAGSDLILVPSRFEPCGLTQMYGMRYGCLPLVHLVGGLADTVRPWRLANESALTKTANTANGFGFSEHCMESFVTCWQEMMSCWRLKPVWEKLQLRGMSLALGWDVAAENYAALYDRMLFHDAHHP